MKGFRAEPVGVAAAIRAVLLVGIAFGLGWTEHQIAAVMLAVELVLALFLRSQVTSESTLEAAGTSRAEMKDVAANPDAQMVTVIAGRMQRRPARQD